jgi:diguanylate cyclase (GGDEF)-like protein/PAS domain S-box-containing protein
MARHTGLFSPNIQTVGLTVLLSSLACLGNMLSVGLAFGVDLIFGTIFVFVAISYLGPRSSMIVALAGGLYTWVMWDHFYASAVFVLEAIIVYFLHRRLNKSLLLSDALFWSCLGFPITLLYLTQAIELSIDSSSLIALKQFINAIFNVLLASFIVLIVNIAQGKLSSFYLGHKQIKDILFYSMVALTLGAGTLPIIQSSKTDERNTEKSLEATLSGPLNHLATDLELSRRPANDVLDEFTSRPRIDGSLSFAVLDQSGKAVASKRDPWLKNSDQVPANSREGELVFIEPEGDLSFVQRLRQGRYQMVQAIENGQPLWVVIQTPAAPFAEKMAQATFNLLLLLGVLLVLGIIVSQVLSRVLTAPIWRLSAALDSSTNGIVITNLEGKVEWINKGFGRISGYSLEDIKGKKPGAILQGVGTDPETVDRIRSSLAKERRFDEEMVNYGKDGRPYWVHINCEPLRGESGKSQGYIAVETDVTEQKQIKELELFGREALEKLAKKESLEDIYQTVLHNVESILPVRCVIELGGSGCGDNSYLPKACYLNIEDGNYRLPSQSPLHSIPIVNSSGEHMGTFRILHRYRNTHPGRELELGNRASQLIAIATERFWSDRKLQETASVFSCVDEGIFITDADFLVLDVNAAFSTITGFTGSQIIGQKANSFISNQGTALLSSSVLSALNQFGQWQGETSIENGNGRVVYLSLSISTIPDDLGEPSGYIFLISDITELKEYQRQLENMAHYDGLTQLPNRVLLGDRLDQAMRKADRYRDRLAVLFIDLDGFKKVNDTMGHEAGDQLLKVVTSRISSQLRDTDTFSRFGGDEFVVVLPELENAETVDDVVRRILAAVEEKILLADRELQITASIGVAFYPQKESLDADQVLRQADQAMYAAKQRGRNCYQYFDMDNDKAVRQFHEIVAEIGAALKNNEFSLFYQPKVNLKTTEIIGAEALIRWTHPTRGLVPPSDFLPLIEHHVLSVEIGEWVLNSALSQMDEWQKQGIHMPISVNINSFHLRQRNFASRLRDILKQHPSVRPRDLELEIVETSALENLETVSGLISECQQMGVSFSLDDFGTGYSSLSYLRRLPVERLKIDMSFVRDMLQDANDFAIVQGVLGLASSFDLAVIAEGVETAEHSTKLIEIGCYFGQGFGIAKPMPSNVVPSWVESWNNKKVDGESWRTV